MPSHACIIQAHRHHVQEGELVVSKVVSSAHITQAALKETVISLFTSGATFMMACEPLTQLCKQGRGTAVIANMPCFRAFTNALNNQNGIMEFGHIDGNMGYD